jgi:hypothetical protein
MSFTVQSMLGDQALVSGTDAFGKTGKTVVSTQQWDELKAKQNFSAAVEDFDAAVAEFFRPLTDAAEAVTDTQPTYDPAEYIVLTEEVEGVEAKEQEIVELTRDSIILRLIEEGTTDRLIWIDESTLGVLASS